MMSNTQCVYPPDVQKVTYQEGFSCSVSQEFPTMTEYSVVLVGKMMSKIVLWDSGFNVFSYCMNNVKFMLTECFMIFFSLYFCFRLLTN